MTTKYTPPPWCVFITPWGITGIGHKDCDFDPEQRSVLHAKGSRLYVTLEDACLMATSPEVVEACDELLKAIDTAKAIGCIDHLDCADDGGEFWYAAINKAKAALAKAKGVKA